MTQPHQHNDSKFSGVNPPAADRIRNGADLSPTGVPTRVAPRIHCYEFSTLLLARRRQLLEEVREQFAAGADHDSAETLHHAAGKADVIDQAKLAVIRRSRKLEEIEVALARIADGDYGRCVDCGDDIDRSVLKAGPTTARCPNCQTRVLPGLLNGEQ